MLENIYYRIIENKKTNKRSKTDLEFIDKFIQLKKNIQRQDKRSDPV